MQFPLSLHYPLRSALVCVLAAILSALAIRADSPVAEAVVLKSERVLSQAIERPEPKYPLMAKRMGVAGDVEIDVVVGLDGKVVLAERSSGHPVLANAAVKAVRKWSFRPFRISGETRRVRTTLTLEFRQ